MSDRATIPPEGHDATGAAAKNGRGRFMRGEPTTAVWREQAIAEITSGQFAVDWLKANERNDQRLDDAAAMRINDYLHTARQAAVDQDLNRRQRLSSAFRGASVERTWGQIDAAGEALLRAAPSSFVIGQLPRMQRRVEKALASNDPRRLGLEKVAQRHSGGALSDRDRDFVLTVLARRLAEGGLSESERAAFLEAIAGEAPQNELTESERELLLAAFHAANCEARRAQTRVRSFRNMLLLVALALTIAAVGLAVLGFVRPDVAPLCFQPADQVVCPTKVVALARENGVVTGQPAVDQDSQAVARQDELARASADPVDILLIELIGMIAAAVAAAAALRDMHGTSTPYGVPLALAILKLPTGALTAVLGLLLMRGQFVPGLSALDSPAQIIGWAIVFGYAQQLFTRFVDQRAQTVLDSAGGREKAPHGRASPAHGQTLEAA